MAWGPYLATSILEVGSPSAAAAEEGSPSIAAGEGSPSVAAGEGSPAAVEGSLALVVVLVGNPALAVLEGIPFEADLDLDITYLLSYIKYCNNLE